jgi:hypothetical protein
LVNFFQLNRKEIILILFIFALQTCSNYSYLQNRELTTLRHMTKGDGAKKIHKVYSICHIVSHFEAWQAHPWLWVSQKKMISIFESWRKPKNTLERHGEVNMAQHCT